HGHLLEGADALEPVEIRQQEFAAPDVPIRAIARAVPRDADHTRIDPVVGQATRDVRVVMLDRHETYIVKHPRVGRRPIAGMEIMSDDAGREIEQALEMADGLRPATVGALVAEIA